MPCVFAVTWFIYYCSNVIHDLKACDEKYLIYRQGFKYVEDLLSYYEIVFMAVKHIQVYCGLRQLLTIILQTVQKIGPF